MNILEDFGGVNKHLFRKIDLITKAQSLLYRWHNSDGLKLYEENNDVWANGEVSASERRKRMATWFGDVWDELCETDFVEKSFKRMGLCNGINGKENQLVKMRKLKTYVFLSSRTSEICFQAIATLLF